MRMRSRKMVGVWIAAIAVGGAALAQPPAKPSGAAVPRPDPARAADPFGTMLSEARTAYAKVRDYSCTFTRQERIHGVLGVEQVAVLKARTKPNSIALRFARPETIAGRELVYVDGARIGKVKYRPGGPQGTGRLYLSPDDPKLIADTRHAPTEIGIGPTLDRLERIVQREKTLGNPLEVHQADYHFAGKVMSRYEVFTRRPHTHRYAYRCLVFVDKETKLPARFEAHDAPKPGMTTGELLEAYSFTDLRMNSGLGDVAFE